MYHTGPTVDIWFEFHTKSRKNWRPSVVNINLKFGCVFKMWISGGPFKVGACIANSISKNACWHGPLQSWNVKSFCEVSRHAEKKYRSNLTNPQNYTFQHWRGPRQQSFRLEIPYAMTLYHNIEGGCSRISTSRAQHIIQVNIDRGGSLCPCILTLWLWHA